jgi:hypothetical protein
MIVSCPVAMVIDGAISDVNPLFVTFWDAGVLAQICCWMIMKIGEDLNL